MYKTKNILKFAVSMLFVVATFTACVKDSNFDTPQIQYEDNDISNSTITAVKNNIIQNYNNATNPGAAQLIYTFPDDSPVVISGYVVSNDKDGNFYKKLVIQDNFENPTAGIEIDIDLRSMYTKYNFGRKIYIKMAGLSVTYLDGQHEQDPPFLNTSNPTDNILGVYKIGIRDVDFKLKRISGTRADEIITRSGVTKEIVPQIITTSDFNDDTMNTYVQMNNIQFELSELGKTFAGEPNDEYDAIRTLLSCETQQSFGLMTSTFSTFKSLNIPDKKGTLEAVLMKNYREASPVVVINSSTDLEFLDTERCDPIILDCGLADTPGSQILLEQNFDSGTIDNGWTNYTEAGTRSWELFNSSSALSGYSAKIGSYSSEDDSTIAWLISPALNMNTQTGETLEFMTSNSWSDGSKLELLFSTDWDGTEAGISSANWGIIPSANIVSDDEFYQNWVSSGIVDLSCAEGENFYIAFKYTGSGNLDFDGTYELDNIEIKY